MMIKELINRFYNKRLFFCFFLTLALVLCGLVVANSFLTTKKLTRAHWTASVDMIDQRMNSILGEINSFPRAAGNDMVFLSGLSSVKRGDLANIKKDFLTFLGENTAYYKLIYIDSQGEIQVLAEYDGENLTTPSDSSPENFNPEWIGDAGMLEKSEVFISPISLIQKGSQSVPVIIYASPIYADNLSKIGIVASVVYADYFLDDIRSSQREGESVFLIDNEGNYLAHVDKQREFGNLLGHDKRFQTDYPTVANEILSHPEKRTVTSGNHVFSTRAIHPTKGSFALYKSSEKIDHGQGPYFWILLSVTDKEYLESGTRELVNGAGLFMLLSLMTLLGIVIIGYLFAFRSKNHHV